MKIYNYFINKNKKVFPTLNYNEHFFTLVFTATGCIFISAFSFLLDIPMGIMSSTLGLSICIVARIKMCKSMNSKKKVKHDKMVLWAKTYLNCIKGLISRYLIGVYIGHDDVLSIHSVLKKSY